MAYRRFAMRLVLDHPGETQVTRAHEDSWAHRVRACRGAAPDPKVTERFVRHVASREAYLGVAPADIHAAITARS